VESYSSVNTIDIEKDESNMAQIIQCTGCSFAVKKGASDDSFFLSIEPYGDSVDIFGRSLITLDFVEEVGASKAKEIEDILNNNIKSITFTQLPTV
jgi:hypothetical protein